MLLMLSEISTFSSVFKLFLLLIVFFILLYGAHVFTKWYAKSGIVNARSSNISFVLFKENAVFLTELSEEELVFQSEEMKNTSFSEILKKAKDFNHKNKSE